MQISVVIPTCNRKTRLLCLLNDLNRSNYVVAEVIIVDSGEERLIPSEYLHLSNIKIIYLGAEKSVCAQRNMGIKAASSPWIFICDDDIEVPPDYLSKIAAHVDSHTEAGAVSGIVLEQERGEWKPGYNISSAKELIFKYIFQLSIWGKIDCRQNNFVVKGIKNYYTNKGNHISKAGWPVVTDFSGDFFITPVYGLGASVIRKNWLELSPYDEMLDRHGIGDNYGVAVGFPVIGIHVLNDAFVYHHKEPVNRLQQPLQYYRRVLALDYFRRTKKSMTNVKKQWLLWSLLGNLVLYILKGERIMIAPAFKAFLHVLMGRNVYYERSKKIKTTA